MPSQAKPPPIRTLQLRWPGMGVVRSQSQERDYSAVDYPAPWAVNCRLEDPIARRKRGGSRTGLLKFLTSSVGSVISDIAPIQIATASGSEETLLVLADGRLGAVRSGTLTWIANTPSAFLVVGRQYAYAVSSSRILKVSPGAGTVTVLTASAGTIPTQCTVGAVYRDRLFLGGHDNAIYVSRQGDYTDWDYGTHVSDTSRPLVFQLSGSSAIGDIPTTLIPCDDGHLLAATSRGIWIVRGDPAAGGGLQNVSSRVGIISDKAWCMTDRQIVFLADDGLYHISQDGSDLLPLSHDKIPDELVGINPATTTVTLGYDHVTRAVHIYLETSSAGDVHWLYEMDNGLFWPMMIPSGHAPRAVCEYDGRLLLAGPDGYIRYVGGENDDGTVISSHILIGPFRIGRPVDFGITHALFGILGSGSGDVTWRLLVGDTAEGVSDDGKVAIAASMAGTDYDQYVAASGVWSAGRSKASWPRARGVWAVLWLEGSSAWAFEAAVLEVIEAGRWR